MLVESGIGSTVFELDAHLERAMKYIEKGQLQNAGTELQNLRQCVAFIDSSITPSNMAYAALVYAIDGKVYKELTDDSITEILGVLSDVPQGSITDSLVEVKKKLDSELSVYFPSLTESSKTKEYWTKLKRYILLKLKMIAEPKMNPNAKELSELSTNLLLHVEPLVFQGPQSVEIEQDKQFENACLALSRTYNRDPKTFSVLEYYNAVFSLSEEARRMERSKQKIR